MQKKREYIYFSLFSSLIHATVYVIPHLYEKLLKYKTVKIEQIKQIL